MSQQDEEEKPEGETIEVVEPEEPDEPQEVYMEPNEIQIQRLNENINQGLKKIGKTADGLGYTYIELDIEGKKIHNLHNVLQRFTFMRKINLANNQIKDVSSLQCLNYLTHLNLKMNHIVNLDDFNVVNTFPFLEELNLDNNKVFNLGQIQLPKLKKLILTNNGLKSALAFTGHATLECLELRNNKLESFENFKNMNSLKQIWAASNQITSISHLSNLPQLHTIHLRGNKLLLLQDIPDLPQLYHLNIRANLIEKLEEFNNLLSLKNMKSLTMHENPIATEMGDGIRKEIIMIFQKIDRVNKEVVQTEERTEALSELKERVAAAIQKKKEEEEEQLRLAEENRLAEEAKLAEQKQEQEQE